METETESRPQKDRKVRSDLDSPRGSIKIIIDTTPPTVKHTDSFIFSDEIHELEPDFLGKTHEGITEFFSGFLKTIAGFAGLAALTTLTGSALVPLIGIPLLFDWLNGNGGADLAKWAADMSLDNDRIYGGMDQSSSVATLARQLQQAQAENTALIHDMGVFLHNIEAIRTLIDAPNIAAPDKEKPLKEGLLKRMEVEVDCQPKLLKNVLDSDLTRAITIINTGGGAYIRGNVNTGGGNFVGRDDITQFMPPEWLNLS